MKKSTFLESECHTAAAVAENHLERLAQATDIGLEKVQHILLAAKSKKQRTFTLRPTLAGGTWGYSITSVTVDHSEFLGKLAFILETDAVLLIDDLSLSDRYDILQQFVNRRLKRPIP